MGLGLASAGKSPLGGLFEADGEGRRSRRSILDLAPEDSLMPDSSWPSPPSRQPM